MTIDVQDSKLALPLVLPCGAVLKNRLVKSAMSDSLGDGRGNSTGQQARLYQRWAEGGVALSIIGEVQITPWYAEKPGNLVLAGEVDEQGLGNLAASGARNGAHIWPQLGHAGALAHTDISKPAGPSALHLDGLVCAQMSLSEIQTLPGLYARAARQAQQLGFTGVQIHAAHGFLLSQFLSPLFNQRTDNYGGSIVNRARLLLDVITEVRTAVGSAFPIGVKINCSDKLMGGFEAREALALVRLLDNSSVDLIEISGGTYFPGAAASSDTNATGAYFTAFSAEAKSMTGIPIQATGGFKTRQQAQAALEAKQLDVVGLARALVLEPNLVNHWLANNGIEAKFPRFTSTVPGGVTAWYTLLLTALAEDTELAFDMDLTTALESYEARDLERSKAWRAHFGEEGLYAAG